MITKEQFKQNFEQEVFKTQEDKVIILVLDSFKEFLKDDFEDYIQATVKVLTSKNNLKNPQTIIIEYTNEQLQQYLQDLLFAKSEIYFYAFKKEDLKEVSLSILKRI